MIDVIVEINLETVVSFSEEDSAAEAEVRHIKDNWFEFIKEHKINIIPKVLCEIKE